jgi:hypothetical protein
VVAKETGRRKASERGRQGSVEERLGLGAWGCGSRGAGVLVGRVDAKCAPSAKHTASRTSWLHTRKESRDVPVNFP